MPKPSTRFIFAASVLTTSFSLLAPPASAQMAENTLREFTRCNSSFFSALATDTATQQAIGPVERKDGIAWIKVKDRKNAPANQVDFNPAITVGGLKLLGYFDEISDMEELGHYYYWGFVVEGSVENVIGNLRPLVSDADRLRGSGSDYARTELKSGNSDWRAVHTGSGTVPAANTIERAFIVEPMENNKNATRVSCSLQGSVSAQVLKTERPDLGPDELPAPPPPPAVLGKPRANVIAAVDAAAPQGSVWRPRFSKIITMLSYGGSKPFKTIIEIDNVEGLLHVREHYTTSSYVERISLSGLAELGSQIYLNKAPMPPLAATELSLSLPATLDPGQTFNVRSSVQRTNDPKAKPVTISKTCTTGATVPANQIHRSLPGSATTLTCTQEGGTPREYAFLQDLGLALLTKEGDAQITYPEFALTR